MDKKQKRALAQPEMFLTASKGIVGIEQIEVLMGASVAYVSPWCIGFGSRQAQTAIQDVMYLGWGRKPSGYHALKLATKAEGKALLLEDGFVGYWGHPSNGAIRLSLVKDESGIYYDASAPSDLEKLIPQPLSQTEAERTQSIVDQFRLLSLTKYLSDQAEESTHTLPSDFVVVIDQTRGDLSVTYGGACDQSFQDMLNSALSENPKSEILIKVHPDVLAKKKSGYLNHVTHPRVKLVSREFSSKQLFSSANKIYVVTSQMGFEALIWGQQVVTFGQPFYAGWGLTEDRIVQPQRRSKDVTLFQLVHAALIRYPVYVHPERYEICELEEIVDWVSQPKEARHPYLALGFSLWKKSFIDKFTQRIASHLDYIQEADQVESADRVICWGARHAQKIRAKKPRSLVTLEDGFIRSVGLGSDLKQPSSIVLDDLGIYYDATRPSRLELILDTIVLNARQIRRAQQLRFSLVDGALTKYNIGQDLPDQVVKATSQAHEQGREIILIPGQVEQDASIEFGSPILKSNSQLIEQVRRDNPEAFLIYKPHPDAVSGNKGSLNELKLARQLCDQVVERASIAKLYPVVDRLATMTSQSGFEALWYGLNVTVYGLPFYAGWGLTDDRIPCPRRQLSLSLDELLYGVLIEYPLYYDWKKGHQCHVESIVAGFQGREGELGSPAWKRWLRKTLFFGQTIYCEYIKKKRT